MNANSPLRHLVLGGCCFSRDSFLEVIAEAYLEAYFCKVFEMVQAHVAIDGRLNADVVIQIEAITNLWGDIDIVPHVTWTHMPILYAATAKYTISLHVVTSCQGTIKDIGSILMIPTYFGKRHQAIH